MTNTRIFLNKRRKRPRIRPNKAIHSAETCHHRQDRPECGQARTQDVRRNRTGTRAGQHLQQQRQLRDSHFREEDSNQGR